MVLMFLFLRFCIGVMPFFPSSVFVPCLGRGLSNTFRSLGRKKLTADRRLCHTSLGDMGLSTVPPLLGGV